MQAVRTKQRALSDTHIVENAISTHYEDITKAAQLCRSTRSGDVSGTNFDLPRLTNDLDRFFSASEVSMTELEPYGDCRLVLLNLMRDASTRTTKTFASLLIVARALHHVWTHGERVMIVTPTSGNKGTALRAAVLRAYELDLASPDELQIVTVVPHSSLSKLWDSELATDPELRRRNPLALYCGDRPEEVKRLAQDAANALADNVLEKSGVRIWYTLDLDNYRVADSLRAFVEADVMPVAVKENRIHAHAVSSAYGLLGYSLGRRVLEVTGRCAPDEHPGLFLVQHLGTPDMVLNLRFASFDRTNLPKYTVDDETGSYIQSQDSSFPLRTYHLDESIDSTFYTHQPPTSKMVNAIVREHGGGGLVVSLQECLERFRRISRMLPEQEIRLPADPRLLREWAVTMAFAGVMNGIDRGLIAPGTTVVVHASGSYSDGEFPAFDPIHAAKVRSADDMRQIVREAAR